LGGPQTGTAADAEDGARRDLPEAQDEHAASGASRLSIPAQGDEHHPFKRCLVHRRDVHPDAERFFVPDRDHGLVQQKAPELAAEQTPWMPISAAKRSRRLSIRGKPVIFNTDQGSQFTSFEFTQVPKEANVRISMDSKGRWMDNVMIERLWRSLKYECVYLHAFETGSEARNGIEKWIRRYNEERQHSPLDDRTPHEAYWGLPIAYDPVVLAA
jgi:transposase InsO family protein